MQSAAAEPALLAEGIEAGADYYLTKPYKGSALVALVRVALARWRESTRLRERVEDLATTVALLSHAEFRFRTIDEAGALAHGLAGLCEAPEMVHIGLTELLVNAVEHGNLDIGFGANSRSTVAGWRVCRSKRSPIWCVSSFATKARASTGGHSSSCPRIVPRCSMDAASPSRATSAFSA